MVAIPDTLTLSLMRSVAESCRDLRALAAAAALIYGAHSPAGCAADDGLFTSAQVARGERLYAEHCASCHGPNLEGKGATPLSGETFHTKWADGEHTVDDLYYIARTSMPYSAPGKLSKQEYIDVIAYVLKVNGYREGEQELPMTPETLRGITIRSR
jgi:mono/diheme cytochrome c family protein